MTDDRHTQLASETTATQRSIVAPVLTWSLVQLGALVLSAARVQLWTRMPFPTEAYALWIMLAAQACASAMLFPWLMRNMGSTAFVIGLSAPFLQLAGMLSGTSGWVIAQVMMGMGLWLAALALWNRSLVCSASSLLGVAVATTFTVGGAGLIYLRMEFTSSEMPSLRLLAWLSIGVALFGAAVGNVLARR
jgi:hypothetical protein